MNIIVYSEMNNSILAKADVIFGLNVVIIKSCNGMSKDDLYTLINRKADVIHSYDMDDVVLKALGLYDRKREFGRMSEACMLYGIVTNFSLSGEKIINYFCNNLGFQNEVKQMIMLDCILHNTDRHEKNFGYLIDSNKNCSFVPLFDNGFCLGANRVASDYVDKVNDFDMKILSGSRFDILSKYGVSIDFDESYALQVIKDAYEYYAVPEEQYEIAKAEIQFSTKTLAQLKSEILVETELDINI